MQCGIQKICGSRVAAAAAAPAAAAGAAAAGAASVAPLADYVYNINARLFKKSGLTEIRDRTATFEIQNGRGT